MPDPTVTAYMLTFAIDGRSAHNNNHFWVAEHVFSAHLGPQACSVLLVQVCFLEIGREDTFCHLKSRDRHCASSTRPFKFIFIVIIETSHLTARSDPLVFHLLDVIVIPQDLVLLPPHQRTPVQLARRRRLLHSSDCSKETKSWHH